jgi:hypothetical protein
MDWGDYDYKYLFFQQVDSFPTQLTIIEFCQLNESVADMLCISGYQLKPGQLSATLALQQPGISTNCGKHYFVPLGTFENSPAIYCRDENTNPKVL